MVTLTKWMDIPEFPHLELLSESGSYDENDLVLACNKWEQEPICQFEAQFVKNGHEAYLTNIAT